MRIKKRLAKKMFTCLLSSMNNRINFRNEIIEPFYQSSRRRKLNAKLILS